MSCAFSKQINVSHQHSDVNIHARARVRTHFINHIPHVYTTIVVNEDERSETKDVFNFARFRYSTQRFLIDVKCSLRNRNPVRIRT